MKTEIDESVPTEIGDTRIRTLSHYLIFKKPRTTVFSNANPFSDATTVTILWDTDDPEILQELHEHLVACVSEHGFAPIKEATKLLVGGLMSRADDKVTDGRDKLSELIPMEVRAHVKFIA